KRTIGIWDVAYSRGPLPLPPSELQRTLTEEVAAAKAIEAASAEPTDPRFADLMFHDGEQPRTRVQDWCALHTGTWYQLEVAVRVKPLGIPSSGSERRPTREPKQLGSSIILVAIDGD